MDKVYVVTSGEYSDYHIVKVFLDKAKAEKYAEVYKKTESWADSVGVEEYIIYDDNFEVTLNEPNTYYVQYIDLDDGKLGWCGEEKVLSTAKSFYDFCYGGIKAYSQKSIEHAKKIAIEQYQIHTQRIFEEQISYEESFNMINEKTIADYKNKH
jgi:hypothetical protein